LVRRGCDEEGFLAPIEEVANSGTSSFSLQTKFLLEVIVFSILLLITKQFISNILFQEHVNNITKSIIHK